MQILLLIQFLLTVIYGEDHGQIFSNGAPIVIISHIIGGLGNQIFQYAVGRAVSLRRNMRFALDVSGFDRYKLHNGFELNKAFNLNVPIANQSDFDGILGVRSSSIVRKFLTRDTFRCLRGSRFIVEPHFHFWPKIQNLQNSSYLVGYWQSERYFTELESVIRSDLIFRSPMSLEDLRIATTISAANAISLHVRRGDYATNPETLAEHGLCGLDYYHAAVRYLVEHTNDPVFFVFSDDTHWVKNNLSLGYPLYFVDHNRGQDSYNDMRLMSMCKHHIIANSSFSWWGAWLNSSKDKIVVAPKRWFANTKRDTKDLIPAGWIQI